MRVETVYRFVNTEKPDEFVDITTYGDGIDQGDKAPGKAMTYGDKYALLKAYKIITGDDPDQNMSEDEKVSRAYTCYCEECKGRIYNDFKLSGEFWAAKDIATYTKKKFGRHLCSACTAKAAKSE